MEQIAIISDIHGNLPALETVLEDIRRRGIRRIFCLGDMVGKGPDSARALDICREVCELIVRGNWDDGMQHLSAVPVIQWHQQQLGPERIAYLAALPNSIDFQLSGKHIRLFHASQESVYHRVHMDGNYDAQMAMFTNTAFTGDRPEPEVVGYGDIHRAYVKNFQGRTLFNVGSVGNPLDMPLAAYTILEGCAGAQPASLNIQLLRLPYPIEEAIAQAAAMDMPELEDYANELRTSRYRGLPKA